MIEKTFVFLKPDAVEKHLIGEIIKRFEERGLKVLAIKGPVMADEKILNDHYPLSDENYLLNLGHVDTTGWTEEQKKEKIDRSYKVVESLKNYVTSGPIVTLILEGDNAVELVREITGKTDPGKSPEGTIRGDLGDDSFEVSDREGRAVRNLVHASGTKEEAEAEIKLWFQNEQLPS